MNLLIKNKLIGKYVYQFDLMMNRLNELIDLLMNWLIDKLVNWLIDRLIDQLLIWLSLVNYLTN